MPAGRGNENWNGLFEKTRFSWVYPPEDVFSCLWSIGCWSFTTHKSVISAAFSSCNSADTHAQFVRLCFLYNRIDSFLVSRAQYENMHKPKCSIVKWKVFVSAVIFEETVLNFQIIIRKFLCHFFFFFFNLCIFSIFTNEFYSLLLTEGKCRWRLPFQRGKLHCENVNAKQNFSLWTDLREFCQVSSKTFSCKEFPSKKLRWMFSDLFWELKGQVNWTVILIKKLFGFFLECLMSLLNHFKVIVWYWRNCKMQSQRWLFLTAKHGMPNPSALQVNANIVPSYLHVECYLHPSLCFHRERCYVDSVLNSLWMVKRKGSQLNPLTCWHWKETLSLFCLKLNFS